jgi:signal transduction histidine kinase
MSTTLKSPARLLNGGAKSASLVIGLGTVKESEFSADERLLISEVAQRLQPRLGEIVGAWTAAIPLAAPADKLPGMRATLAAIGREVVGGLFHALSTGDPEQALTALEETCARLIHHRLPDPAANHRLTIKDLMHASRLLREIVDREIALAFKDESDRELRARLGYARIWNRSSESLAGIYSQLYEQQVRQHQRELRAARDTALEASRVKSAFVANMTHEIRTPLNVILGYADLMAERLAELRDESGIEYGEPIRRAGQRLLDTIGAVLDLSRIESGAFELKPATILLADLVERHVEDLSVLARKKGLALACQIDEPGAKVIFDEHCLSNTIINLLHNAIKFTERGGVSVRVFRDRAGVLSMEVRDTGRGIDPAYLPHLFEPFTQEGNDALPSHEGAGLGLALVKRYVEFNRAKIAVESIANSGTAFTVSFSEEPGSVATA